MTADLFTAAMQRGAWRRLCPGITDAEIDAMAAIGMRGTPAEVALRAYRAGQGELHLLRKLAVIPAAVPDEPRHAALASALRLRSEDRAAGDARAVCLALGLAGWQLQPIRRPR